MTGRAYDREFPPVRPSPEFVPAHETERRFSSRGWDSSRSSVETGTEILHPATGLRLRVVKIPPTGASGEFGLTHGKRGRCSSHRRESARATGAKPPGAAAGIRPGPRRESARGRGGGGRGRMKASGRPAEDEPRSDGAELATWGDSPRSRLHTCRRRPFFTPPKEIWCREPGSSEGNMAMSHGWPPQQRRCLHWWSRFGMLSPPVEVKLEFDAIGGDVRSGVRVDRAAYGFWRCVPATDAPAYSPVETRRHFVPTSGGRYRFRRRRWRCVVSRPGNPPTL